MYKCLIPILFSCILAACNNKPAEQSEKTAVPSLQEAYLKDTIPEYDSLPEPVADSLDEATQLRLFKSVLKDVKTKKLYDFRELKNDKLLGTYKNFQQTFNSFRDSADQRYMGFFSTFFENLQSHEEELLNIDSLDVRTRLEIARIKSDINAGFALRKLTF